MQIQTCVQQPVQEQWLSQQHLHPHAQHNSQQYQEETDFGNLFKEAMDSINQPSIDIQQASHKQANPSEDMCHACRRNVEILMKEMKELKQMKDMQAAAKKFSLSTSVQKTTKDDPAPNTTDLDIDHEPTTATGDIDYDKMKGNIKAAIVREKKVSVAVKKAIRTVFSLQELTTCSMRGLHTNKSCEIPIRGLPVAKRDAVQDVIAETFSITTEENLTNMRTALGSLRGQWSGLNLNE